MITMNIPGNIKSGTKISGLVRVNVEINGSETKLLEIPVYIRVIGNILVYENNEPLKTVDFGVVEEGVGAKKKLMVRVRDKQKVVDCTNIEVKPDFVKAEFKPIMGANGKPLKGTYHLYLEIPPECYGVYQTEDEAWIHLQFDHPRISKLDLGLKFTVFPKPKK